MKRLIQWFGLGALLMAAPAQAQGWPESLNRGLVAIKNGSNTFLTVFEGLTGRAVNTVWYNPNRSFTTGEVKAQTTEICNLWGDSYGNRQDRFLACAAHLDGADKNASAIFCRGYYTRAYLWAVDFDGQQLKTRWLHGSISGSEVELTDGEVSVNDITEMIYYYLTGQTK